MYGDLPATQRDAVFLHELLHAALLHPLRRGLRDPKLFNIAADIVVNGMVVADDSLELPNDSLRSEKLEHLSVEEIYEILQKKNPASRPELPTLWVVVAGGLEDNAFPWDEVTRLAKSQGPAPSEEGLR